MRTLPTCIDHTQGIRLYDQLFIRYTNPTKSKVLSKQRLSHWVVEAISLAYDSKGLSSPNGVREHSCRNMAASWALFKGVSVSDIYSAASWSSPHTWFYRLDVGAHVHGMYNMCFTLFLSFREQRLQT